MAKEVKTIEQSIKDELNNYPWGNLFRDDQGGIGKYILPAINVIMLVVILVKTW